MSEVIDTIRVNNEVLSPAEFLEKVNSEKSNIVRSRIAPPRLGSSGFGGIEVEYASPIFRPAFDSDL